MLSVVQKGVNTLKVLKCIRCGVCCKIGPCSKGKEGKDGVCLYLNAERDGTTSCSLVVKGEVKPEQVGIDGSGCVLRKSPGIYEYYKNRF